ncbi:MAG: response regulator [Verrucomicrobiales bacterium]
MLIEENAETANQLLTAWKEAGISNPITTFISGNDAAAFLNHHAESADRIAYPLPCFILLNLELKDMPAIDFLKWLRSHPKLKRMPVVALCARDELELFHQAYDAGANSCLVKPLAAEELMRVVKSINGYWVILVEKPMI